MSNSSLCQKPIRLAVRGGDERLVRCRNCDGCFRALRRYWAAAVEDQIRLAALQGCRSWFGTLTFRPSAFRQLMIRAQEAGFDNRPWDKLNANERAQVVHEQTLHEVQKYWKRLRKGGLLFRYFLAFERQQSGAPHLHWVLHESEPAQPVRKRDLQARWPHGFMAARVVDAGMDGDKKVAAYVTKVLASGKQSRVCASQSYKPRPAAVSIE